MWNTFNSIAEKAKAAAKDLDKQLNESVGVEQSNHVPAVATNVVAMNDAWADDFDLDEEVTAYAKPGDQPVVADTPVSRPEAVPDPSPALDHVGVLEGDENDDDARNADESELVLDETSSVLTNQESLPTQPSGDNLTEFERSHENESLSLTEPALVVENTTTLDSIPATDLSTLNSNPPDTVQNLGSDTDSGTCEPSNKLEVPQPNTQGADDSVDQKFPQNDNLSEVVKTHLLVNELPTEDDVDTLEDRGNGHVVKITDTEAPSTAALETPIDVDVSESLHAIPNQLEATEEVSPQPAPRIPVTIETEPALAESTDSTVAPDSPKGQHPADSSSVRTESAFGELSANQEAYTQLKERLAQVEKILQQREDQLVNKTEQLTTMQSMFESEKHQLIQKIQNTKEEAKRRMQMAKERVEATEARFQALATSQGGASEEMAKQAEIISELRTEGEKLALKQLEMEKSVRNAKGESRELREQLELESEAKESAFEKVKELETDLKETKQTLLSARKGESQAGKLEANLQLAKEESERKSATIMSLEQQIKELKIETKDLTIHLESSKKGAVMETEREQKKLRKEHSETIADLENKIKTGEREAAVREDALRHEVAELRKRWQDAVRRADALSMDVQSSSAPLLRQLESLERQGRARTAAWAELETKLRVELEETIIANEKLSKERTDWKTQFTRLERSAKENEDDLRAVKIDLDDRRAKVDELEEQVQAMESEGSRMKEEWAEVERLANEGVSRVRSEMTQTVVEAEERHRSQLDAIEGELRQERNKRRQLEEQVQGLLDSAGMLVPLPVNQSSVADAKPKKLRRSQDQADILAGALSGLGGEEDHEEDDSDSDGDEDNGQSGRGSYAALEQLTSRLRVTKVELSALRKSLAESERVREKMVAELAESRNAKEKMPFFEAKVQELTAENREQALEIDALQEDVAEVRELYRTQLNVLLEEKAAMIATDQSSILNGLGKGVGANAMTTKSNEDSILSDNPADDPFGDDNW
jgi:chromosome segregation ATPase